MSRDDGFTVMDVSSDIINDPKIRKLYRHAPDHASAAVVAYVATMGESWKAGRRVTIDDSWPAFLPFDQSAVEALVHVRLIDSHGMVMPKAWRGWYEVARERRAQSRARWARHNETRAANAASGQRGDDADTTRTPRGSDAVTAASVPPVRPSVPPEDSREIPPPPAERGRRSKNTNPRATGDAPRTKRTNPRSTGTSTRQRRVDEKTGPTALGSVLRQAANGNDGWDL